ncbi:MAG: RiPP maturation radical SAM C-methyltransferase [Verrucomicrobiae bacterium]|nr:RiPP maturation radical SAM C-methyltransferase [Verrucomicrobiae bacterium]
MIERNMPATVESNTLLRFRDDLAFEEAPDGFRLSTRHMRKNFTGQPGLRQTGLLLRRLRELSPDIVTMMGGANCMGSMGMATHRECPWVDFVVSGEADDIFPTLCRAILDRGRDVDAGSLPLGVIAPSARRQPRSPPDQPYPWTLVTQLDQSPIPDYSDYFDALRQSPLAPSVHPAIPFETSRGCWWGMRKTCTFCGLNTGEAMKYRAKSATRVLDELKTLSSRHNIRDFCAVDNILGMSAFKDLIPALAKDKPGYDIVFETKANLTRKQVHQLAEAGLCGIQPGIESFDDELLRQLGKGTNTLQNIQLLKWTRETGLFTAWLMLYEFPGETDAACQRMSEWLPLISHLQPPRGMAYIQFCRFSPFQTRPEKFGLNLRAATAYFHIYPFSGETLTREFAYYFDDIKDGQPYRTRFGGQRTVTRPGLVALRNVVAQWQIEWRSRYYPEVGGPFPASLAMLDKDGQLTFFDTRGCVVGFKSSFTGLAREVYLACDTPQTQNTLLQSLAREGLPAPQWAEIEPLLAKFKRCKLLLELDGRYLSLAVRWPIKPSRRLSKLPGGQLDTLDERRIREYLKNVASQTIQSQGAGMGTLGI